MRKALLFVRLLNNPHPHHERHEREQDISRLSNPGGGVANGGKDVGSSSFLVTEDVVTRFGPKRREIAQKVWVVSSCEPCSRSCQRVMRIAGKGPRSPKT
jgi:hypothetical protein